MVGYMQEGWTNPVPISESILSPNLSLQAFIHDNHPYKDGFDYEDFRSFRFMRFYPGDVLVPTQQFFEKYMRENKIPKALRERFRTSVVYQAAKNSPRTKMYNYGHELFGFWLAYGDSLWFQPDPEYFPRKLDWVDIDVLWKIIYKGEITPIVLSVIYQDFNYYNSYDGHFIPARDFAHVAARTYAPLRKLGNVHKYDIPRWASLSKSVGPDWLCWYLYRQELDARSMSETGKKWWTGSDAKFELWQNALSTFGVDFDSVKNIVYYHKNVFKLRRISKQEIDPQLIEQIFA